MFQKNKEYKKRYLKRSLIKIIALLLLGTVMVYGINNQTSITLYFILILILYFRTKDNALGLAILFILALNPWTMFYSRAHSTILSLTSTVGISYKIFFAFIIILKQLYYKSSQKQYIPNYIKPYYKLFTIYLIFLIPLGFLFGHSARSLFDLLNTIIIFSLFLVLPKIFDNKSFIQFNRILFAFSLIHTIFSLVDILSQGAIVDFLVYGRNVRKALVDDGLVRVFGGMYIALYTSFTSLYYIASQKKGFKSWYLWLIFFSSILLIINSATRGWMLASFFLFFSFLIFYSARIFSNKKILLGAIVISILGIFIMPKSIIKNISASFARFETLEAVAEGDMTAEGTASRWDERGPLVLTKFHESPVFGFGFSEITSEYYDAHVGNHTVLLMGGIIGLSIMIFTILYIFYFIFRLEKSHPYYKGIFVLGLALIAIMIIHSTNMIMVSYVRMPPESAFIIALLFNQVNAHIHEFRTTQIV